MNQQEDLRRKYTGNANYKTVAPSNPLIVNKDWKRSDVSREKEDKKIIIDRPPLKITTVATHNNHISTAPSTSTGQQQNNRVNPKAINFKNLKEKQTVVKKQTTVIPSNTLGHQKNIVHPVIKPSVQYYGASTKNMNMRPPEPHGISINVNIQNMISQKQVENMNLEQQSGLSDRSGLGDDKKSKKLLPNNMISKIDDFECKEELVFKRTTPLDKQNKVQDKTVQKRPLIDRTKHKVQSQTKPTTTVPIKLVDAKQQIKKFESEIENINSASQAEAVTYLDHRQQYYMIPPHYIEKNQKNFNWKMRVTLFEWMMHVSYQFSIKRETFYIAVNLVDLFLSKQWNLQRTDFQLAGTAAMFIASKLEQFEPKCSDQFAKATKKYSSQEVKQMERKICKSLKYTLNPPTLSTWSNRFMLQWDTFLQQNPSATRHPLFATCQPKYFKKCDTESYRRYRTVMQFLDCATLDIQTVQYQPKLLVCAFMYLVLGHSMGVFKQDEIWMKFPRSSLYLIDDDNLFNDLFMTFLQASFNIMLIDLLPTVQYCATYYGLTLNFEQPITPPGSDLDSIDFQDYCSFQTYNPSAKSYVFNTRMRGMYD